MQAAVVLSEIAAVNTAIVLSLKNTRRTEVEF